MNASLQQIAADELVLLIEDDADKIEISTAARINGRMIPVCTVETGFNEPMDSVQRRHASQLVDRFNCHDDLLAALRGLMPRYQKALREAGYSQQFSEQAIFDERAVLAKAEGRS